MDKRIVLVGLAVFIFIFGSILTVNAAGEIEAYCVAPGDAVPHGSTVALSIKFADSDKSNDFIVQGPFKVLRYENGKAIIVEYKRGNDKDEKGKENPEKPSLTFSVTLSPKHKLPAPATETVTFTYFVKHKEGKRGELFTTEREQQVDCSFVVQHDSEEPTTPSGGGEGDGTQKTITPADLGVNDVGILPSSKWYFLKEFSRSISRFFTFTAVGKAELEMEIANEKAAEALSVQAESPDDPDALAAAIENYTDAEERLRARLAGLKVTAKNPNVEKLLLKLDEYTLKHAVLLNQLAERWSTDPYVEDANVVNPKGARDNNLQGAVDAAQKKIQEVVDSGAQKETNIEEKAAAQIDRAEMAIQDLDTQLAEFDMSDAGALNAKTGIRLDPTPARISTNLTIERQTQKRDFGDRMKAGLDTAGGMLANGKMAFAEGKFGEAFGIARAAEVHAVNTSRVLAGVLRADLGGLEDGVIKITPPEVGPVPTVPEESNRGEEKPAESVEIRVFPETNNSPRAGEVPIPKPTTVSPVPSPAPSQPATITPPLSGEVTSSGYSFKISGYVHDLTDAPAMTSGTPIPGVVLRATGPKGAIAQTQSNGAYTLVFTNAGEGTYEVCIAVPSGYTPPSDPSECESMTVRLVQDNTLELTVNGNAALHNTSLNYNLMRQPATISR